MSLFFSPAVKQEVPALGEDLTFILSDDASSQPEGWSLLSFTVNNLDNQPRLIRVAVWGMAVEGHPQEKFEYRVEPGKTKISQLMKLPRFLEPIRVQFFLTQAKIQVTRLRLKYISRIEATVRTLSPLILNRLKNPKALLSLARGLLGTAKQGGVTGLKSFLRLQVAASRQDFTLSYQTWINEFDTLTEQDRLGILARIEKFKEYPLFSIIMPVYNVDPRWLIKAVESVQNQIYQNWELCIADDASTDPSIRAVLSEFAAKDSRIKTVFRRVNGHISVASNSALGLATGEFVVLLDHDDSLTEHALYFLAEELNRHPNLNLIYSDEDKIDEHGNRFCPHFKSDWNLDVLLSYNMVTHLAAFRAQVVRDVGGFRAGYEGSQDYDLTFRVSAVSAQNQIKHIPFILYHWRAIEGSAAESMSAKKYARDSAMRAITDYLATSGTRASIANQSGHFHRVKYSLPQRLPLVSAIICTRDKVDLLKVIVTGLLERTDYSPMEIIIVNNQSSEPATLSYFQSLLKNSRVTIVDYDHAFNFSAMNNEAVKIAKGEVIALLNNDLEIIHKDWLKEMISHLGRDRVGIVGAKLYYPSSLVQHAGVVLGIQGIAGHSFLGLGRHESGYFGRAVINQEVSAVTGACLILPKQVFEKVGGLDGVNLRVAFNDIDLCMKVRDAGYRIIWTPFAELYHHESATRGPDTTPENAPRFRKEISFMKDKWGQKLVTDPFYNPNLSIVSANYDLAFPPRVIAPWKSAT